MWAYNANRFITKILYWPVSIIGLVTTFVGGFLLGLPIVGLLLMLAFQIIWLPILGILLGTGWVWHKAPAGVRSLLVPIGVLFAVLGNTALACMPAGGNPEDMWSKRRQQTLCQSWPWPAWMPDGRRVLEVIQEEEGKSFFSAAFEFAEAMLRRDAPGGLTIFGTPQ